MHSIIYLVFFVLCFIVNPAYAENMILKGSFFPGTKYVYASFVPTENNKLTYEINLKEYDGEALNIINELSNICNGNDKNECEIVANIEKLPKDSIYVGVITNIEFINRLKVNDIKLKKNDGFVNKYNECLKSSKKLSNLSKSGTNLIKKAELILNKNEIDELRMQSRSIHSTEKDNPAEQMSKDRNISLCDAYIELAQDFIDMTESWINQKISENEKRNKFVDCSKFRFVSNDKRWINGLYSKNYFYPDNMRIKKVIINDTFEVPLFGTKQANDNREKLLPFFYNSPPNILTINDLKYEYDKISLYDFDGNICVIENKRQY